MSEALQLSAATAEPDAVGFLLVPEFAMMSYAAVAEPLRAANRIAGRALYTWRHFSPDGLPVAASNGLAIVPDGRVGDAGGLDLLIVCAGGNPSTFEDPRAFAWLRGLSRRGAVIGAVSGGPYILARAGLLDGRRATLHWEHIPAFREDFPKVDVTERAFEIDGDRVTAAGGIAAFDLMVELIARRHGPRLAAAVADWYLRRDAGAEGQRIDAGRRHAVADPRLARALALMEADLSRPVDRESLARSTGIGLRRLESLFSGALATSIARHHLTMRLDRARLLLRQSALSVTEIATATGFVSQAHFSRAYRGRYGRPPRDDRRPD